MIPVCHFPGRDEEKRRRKCNEQKMVILSFPNYFLWFTWWNENKIKYYNRTFKRKIPEHLKGGYGANKERK